MRSAFLFQASYLFAHRGLIPRISRRKAQEGKRCADERFIVYSALIAGISRFEFQAIHGASERLSSPDNQRALLLRDFAGQPRRCASNSKRAACPHYQEAPLFGILRFVVRPPLK